jgi:hypothetical protein
MGKVLAKDARRGGWVEHVVGLVSDAGDPVYWLETDDGHSYGSFRSAAEARAYASREGVVVRGSVRRRKSCV